MTPNYSAHIFSLSALFVLGNTLLDTSFYNVGILYFFIAAFLSLCVAMLILKLEKSSRRKTCFFKYVVCGVAIIGVIDAAVALFKFVSIELLPKTNDIAIILALLVVVIFFWSSKKTAICKYALATLPLCIGIIAVCFVVGIKNYNLTEQVLNEKFDKVNILLRALSFVVLPFFAREQNCKMRFVSWGVATGFVVFGMCFAQVLFTFANYNNVNFPYLKAVSVISIGSLFTRLDGLVYFLFFVTYMVKISICVKTLKIK